MEFNYATNKTIVFLIWWYRVTVVSEKVSGSIQSSQGCYLHILPPFSHTFQRHRMHTDALSVPMQLRCVLHLYAVSTGAQVVNKMLCCPSLKELGGEQLSGSTGTSNLLPKQTRMLVTCRTRKGMRAVSSSSPRGSSMSASLY